jgi:hypothetical protein
MVSPVHGDYRRCQAEIPLIILCRFPGPALTLFHASAHCQVASCCSTDDCLAIERTRIERKRPRCVPSASRPLCSGLALPIRPDIGAAFAAGRAGEPTLDIRQPNVIVPAVSVEARRPVRAMIVTAMEQDPSTRAERISAKVISLMGHKRQLLCRFSDAGMTRLSTRCGDRRPKSANARSRGSMAPGSAASAMGIVCWWRSRWWTRREQNASTTSAFWHERCTSGFLMFLARVISNGCAWQKQHIPQPLRD